MIEVYEHANIEGFDSYASTIREWSALWWGDFEEAGIERCYVAFDGDVPVGFQTVDGDGLCTAIEVHPDYQGKGVALALIEESGCYRPDRNENPRFWEKMEEKYGY